MDSLSGPAVNQLKAPYAERWLLLKDAMVQLYIKEGKEVKEIAEIMKAKYQFYASVNQYKRQFGLWNLKKALPTKKKAKIRQTLETRAQQGKSSVVLHNGNVENRKMRRYMKEQARKDISIWVGISVGAVDLEELSGHALQCGNRVHELEYACCSLTLFKVPGRRPRFTICFSGNPDEWNPSSNSIIKCWTVASKPSIPWQRVVAKQ